ncbi:hypothetical protein HKX48_001961 [Thoreauomyces humboldtii]|nr:hypothetical protein HKX48_001961 [Thoreauomyces humboldtii]
MSDSSSDGDTNDLTGLLVACGVQFLISAGLVAGFSVLRPRNKAVYEPRFKYCPEEKRPQQLGWTPTAWISPTFKSKEDLLVNKIGFDAVMLLRFLRFCCLFFLGLTCVGIPLCIMHWVIQRNDSGTSNNDGFANPQLFTLSMNSVREHPQLLWIHVSLVYAFSGFAYYLLYRVWRYWITYRLQYLSSPDYQDARYNRTLLLTNLPENMRTPSAVIEFMQKLDSKIVVQQAVVGKNVKGLHALIKEHQKNTSALEDALATYLDDPYRPPKNRPVHKIDRSCFCCGGEQVDTITHRGGRLRELERQIYEIRASVEESSFQPSAYAFVAYRSTHDAHTFASKINGPASVIMRRLAVNPPAVKLSPDFDDLIWENLGIVSPVRHSRRLFAIAIVIGITIAWTPFNSLLTVLTSQQDIKKYVPAIGTWMENSKAASVFVGSIAAPALFAFLQILPPIGFSYLARFQGVLSKTGVDKSVMHKTFAFQVYQYASILVLSITSTTVASYLKDDKNAKVFSEHILQDIADTFLNKSAFFTLIVLTEISSLGIEIIQGFPLVIGFIKRRLFANTPRKQFEYNQALDLPFGAVYASLLIKFLLGISYSVATPVILPFTSLFFFIAYLIYKYQLLYVYETPLETHGSWWPKVFNIVCICMGVFHIMTLGGILFVTGSDSKGQASAVFAMFLLNFIFWWGCRHYLVPQGNYVSHAASANWAKTRTDNLGPVQQQEEEEELEDRVYNPALISPLRRIWVWSRSQEVLPKYYEPEYADLNDYISKQGLLAPKSAKSDAGRLKARVTAHRNAKRVMSFLHRHPLHAQGNAEGPPELEAAAKEAGEELPVVMVDNDDEEEDPERPRRVPTGRVHRSFTRQDAIPVAAESDFTFRPVELNEMVTPPSPMPSESSWAAPIHYSSSENLTGRTAQNRPSR